MAKNSSFSKKMTEERRLVALDLMKMTFELLGVAGGSPAKPLEIALVRCAAGSEIEIKGFDALDFRMLCLQTHYRRPLELSWVALETARADREALRNCALDLRKRGNTAVNTKGLHAYRRRFLDALADDLNSPAALSILWDCLRPGALSPGSQMGMLKAVDPVLGLKVLP